MNENINLCEILKDCPHGTKFYSPTHGIVTLTAVKNNKITVLDYRNCSIDYSKNGRYCPHIYGTGECTIFPSKDQRDWSKFHKPKFDPKTLKPFDKVLVTDEHHTRWRCSFFSHIVDQLNYKYFTIDSCYKLCIPYNDKTKHLVGTNEEAPEYYRYWED